MKITIAMEDTIRILLAEDHPIFRKAISALLKELPGTVTIAEAANGGEALSILQTQEIDIVLLDIQMPEINGIDAMKVIGQRHPSVRVIVFTQFDDHAMIVYMFNQGACSWLPKNIHPNELKNAILQVHSNGYYFNEHLLKVLRLNGMPGNVGSIFALTSRESQLLELIVAGKSSKEIAYALDLSVDTIASYRKSIMKKTNAKSAVDLARKAFQSGFSSLEAGGAKAYSS